MNLPLRWLGGKRRLYTEIRRLTAEIDFKRLVDPFLGGGSTLHIFSEKPFVAADSNSELMEFHSVCSDRPVEIYRSLMKLEDNSDTYYKVRSSRPKTSFGRAVRFLYLNRTAYGGMYRVNARGVFNVPYGGGGRLKVAHLPVSLKRHSDVLKFGTTFSQDFRATIRLCQEGDLLFIDPPYYSPGHSTFNRYAPSGFDSSDRQALVDSALGAVSNGVYVIATLPSDADLLTQFVGWRLISTLSSRSMPRGEMLLVSANIGDQVGGAEVPAAVGHAQKLLSAVVPELTLVP